MEVLVIDVGGTGVKLRTSTSDEVRRFRSGPELTPEMLVEKVTQKTADWRHDVVSIGYPGSVAGGSVIAEPGNLEAGGGARRAANTGMMRGRRRWWKSFRSYARQWHRITLCSAAATAAKSSRFLRSPIRDGATTRSRAVCASGKSMLSRTTQNRPLCGEWCDEVSGVGHRLRRYDRLRGARRSGDR